MSQHSSKVHFFFCLFNHLNNVIFFYCLEYLFKDDLEKKKKVMNYFEVFNKGQIIDCQITNFKVLLSFDKEG